MEANPFAGFANTFLVENGSERPSIQTVGPDEDISRRKRPHRKSRLGCVRCKQRKVKCDEEYPCGNCTKRNETCVRNRPPQPAAGQGNRQQQQGQSLSPSPSIPQEISFRPPTISSEPADDNINLLHMELLHHFERFTIPTLCFQEIWPTMLQLAFHSQQHTYLVNAVLSLAAAHKSYLSPHDARYHRANYSLLDKALREYRKALSNPITSTNCDALLGTAILIHHLMWCDLSFMDVPATNEQEGLDLSADRLYYLSTGVRQIFFMAWPLFQTHHSVFMKVPVLQPCMALEEEVDARGLSWQRIAAGFIELYDNPRYQGGRGAFESAYTPSPLTTSSTSRTASNLSSPATSTAASQGMGMGVAFDTTTASNIPNLGSGGVQVPEQFSLGSQGGDFSKVRTLWDSYKSGEAFVQNSLTLSGQAQQQQQEEAPQRAAYERLVVRLAVAIAFIEERGTAGNTSCPAAGSGGSFSCQFSHSAASQDAGSANATASARPSSVTKADIVRYVLTFPMLCFGPFLPLISSGDSRALVVLLHIYRVVGILLPTDDYWWCRKRAEVMERVIGEELRARGLEICIRRRDEVC